MSIIIRTALITLLVSVISACTFVHTPFANEMKRPHYETKQLIINRNERTYYTLKIGSESPNTIIFFFTGSGCHDTSYMLHPLYANLKLNAEILTLPKKGVKRNSTGDTCSKVFAANDNTDNHVTDNVKLINHALKNKRYKNVILVGHSEGAGLAWRVAEKHSGVSHVYVMHRGLGMNNLDELKQKTKIGQSHLKTTYDNLISDMQGTSNHFANNDFIIIKNKQSWASFLRDKRVPANVLVRTNKKVFILMGDRDTHVPTRSMYLARQVFCKQNNPNLTTILKQGYGHSIDVTGPTRAAELKIMEKWIKGEPLNITAPFKIMNCRNSLSLLDS